MTDAVTPGVQKIFIRGASELIPKNPSSERDAHACTLSIHGNVAGYSADSEVLRERALLSRSRSSASRHNTMYYKDMRSYPGGQKLSHFRPNRVHDVRKTGIIHCSRSPPVWNAYQRKQFRRTGYPLVLVRFIGFRRGENRGGQSIIIPISKVVDIFALSSNG